MEPLRALDLVTLQKVSLPAYPVHGKGESSVAESAVVARTDNSAAKTEKQRGATMLLEIRRDGYRGM